MKTPTLILLGFIYTFAVNAYTLPTGGRVLESTSPETIHFKENKGQVSDQFYKARPDVLFTGSNDQLIFHLKKNGISYQFSRVDSWKNKENAYELMHRPVLRVPEKMTLYRLDAEWLGANKDPEVIRDEALEGYENYYLSSCPNGALKVKSYTQVTYKNVYSGIDLKWYGKDGNLKYDYQVSANSDYKQIQLKFEGAEKIYVNRKGELVIETPLGKLTEQKPLVSQNNKYLDASWIVIDNTVSFRIAGVNPFLPLVIDPLVRLWGTYYGGNMDDDSWYVHPDASGSVFMSGGTQSLANIATTGAHQTTYGGGLPPFYGDAYLVKFDASGVRLWATYYGGDGGEAGTKIVSDAFGNSFLVGETTSTNSAVMATPGAHQATCSLLPSNTADAFLVKFDAAGIRQWATYYGGDDEDGGYGVSLDNSGNIYIAGGGSSANGIATPGCHQPVLNGAIDCFLVKFNAAGVRQWGTYYGGNSANEFALDCVADPSGDVYIGGVTQSTTGISTPGSHQPAYGGGNIDQFIAKFNTSGVRQWGTYYGGPGTEGAADESLALDAAGNLYFTGASSAGSAGTIIATPGSHQPTYGGGFIDAYLVKLDPSGVRQWATWYGGAGNEFGTGVSVDQAGNVYLGGGISAPTSTAIVTPCAYQSIYAGGSDDLFFVKFSPNGIRFWGSYYGSIFSDYANNCKADAVGNFYICGTTLANAGTVIATPNSHQPVYGGGGSDAFLVKFDACSATLPVNTTPLSNLKICPGQTTTLNIASCAAFYLDSLSSAVLGTGTSFTTGPLVSDTTFYAEESSCGSSVGRTAIHVTVAPLPPINIASSNPTACVGESTTITATGGSTYSWTTPVSTAVVISPSLQVFILLTVSYTVTGVDANGCKNTASITITPNLCLGMNQEEIRNLGISIYPNPGTGEIHIRSASSLDLVLTDELGQRVRFISLSSSNNFETQVNGLANGIYFVTGGNEQGRVNEKIIILK